jgi:transposase
MRHLVQESPDAFAGQVLFVGIDVHKKQWTCSVRTNRISLDKPIVIEANAKALSSFLNRRYPGGTFRAVYEAGYSGFWPARELSKEAIATMVVNPADVPSKNKELANKTDRVDSVKLARALENGELQSIYIPNREAEEFRALNRYRNQLIKDQTRLKNRLKAMLAQFNYRPPAELEGRQSKALQAWLEGIRFETPYAQLAFNERLRQLAESRQRQARILRQMRHMASQDTEIAQVIVLLQSIPGIGLLTAVLLVTELIDIRRFKTADDLVAFVGLVPRVHQSDETSYQRGLSNRRNAELRSRLIEAAWIAARKDPALTLKFGQFTQRMHRNKAIIRIAKLLVKRIRHVWKTKTPYAIDIIA